MIVWLTAMAAEPSCEGCHTEVHQAWLSSRHAMAFTNPSFQAIWSRWKDPWCTSCHDPQGGVGCTDCHLQEGQLVSPHSPSARALAVHAIVEQPDLATQACSRCHTFYAPQGGGALQITADEHATWNALGGQGDCADCHGGGHAVPSSRDPSRVRSALSATVRRDEAGYVATLTMTGLGHRFPTGDPWRRLVLELLAGDETLHRWTLARYVEGVDAAFRAGADHRLPLPDITGTSKRTLHTTRGEGATRWRLSYLLGDPSHDELAASEAGYVVAEGEIE